MTELLRTERLLVREWTLDDVDGARATYGNPEVTRWMVPAVDPVPDRTRMRKLLGWVIDQQRTAAPGTGRWAIERRPDGAVIGGAELRRLPVAEDDIELAWQLNPAHWGHGYATESGRALAGWAFDREVAELFAVARPGNTRAAGTARRVGMHWVGQTTKYYGIECDIYRLRGADLRAARDSGVLGLT